MLDESMPGGRNPDDPTKQWKYGEGDTLTHEVGHWLMLEHVFTPGQADRMSDAWQQFRAGGGKGS
jgi:hypothetical protein